MVTPTSSQREMKVSNTQLDDIVRELAKAIPKYLLKEDRIEVCARLLAAEGLSIGSKSKYKHSYTYTYAYTHTSGSAVCILYRN